MEIKTVIIKRGTLALEAINLANRPGFW